MANLKRKIGRLIPYPVIENARKLINLGPRRCPVCRGRVRRYIDNGYGFDVLEKLQVIGGLTRPADRCPICHSTARERLIWFWLTNKGEGFVFSSGIRVAHFAPEKGLTRCLQEATAHYSAYDFDPSLYRHLDSVTAADLSKLDIGDDSVDLLMCNHVIEHVPDVQLALSEILRVLKPGGTAILQVPIALNLDHSIELGTESSPADRVRLVGQDDHLRLFNNTDYVSALQEAGFVVTQYRAFEDDPSAATDWQLDPFETLFVCRKPD